MKYWKKLSSKEIKRQVVGAVANNVNYDEKIILGIPASELDEKVFYKEDGILKDAPFLYAMSRNPNHIGCHTMGDSEEFFKGTHKIEQEVLKIASSDILDGGDEEFDGYIASGGTEANIQAIWIYRNYFKREFNASNDEIVILCSEDSHYSMPKGGDILNIDVKYVEVDDSDRSLLQSSIDTKIEEAKKDGVKYFIVVANMMTTMFGSIDDINLYTDSLDRAEVNYKVHIDGAYGGFVAPFSSDNKDLLFSNPKVNSVTLDAHKMLQAPFGTGIFVIRKDWMQYAVTKEAKYVRGMDATLIGSRSGANAVAVWMLLMTYGPHGWFEKIHILNYRTGWVCNQLDRLNIEYFREPSSNIVTIRAKDIPSDIAKRYNLVPDTHEANPSWYKIVVMDHVTVDNLSPMIEELKNI